MPTSMIAAISSDVATGRRMKRRDGLIRWLRRGAALSALHSLLTRCSRSRWAGR